MKFIDPKVEIWTQGPGIKGMYEHVEKCARICYKSQPKGEPKKFVEMLIKRGHFRPLEAGTLVFDPTEWNQLISEAEINIYGHYNPWCQIQNGLFITNFRWFYERCQERNLDWEDQLKYVFTGVAKNVNPSQYRPTLHWNISRGIADEFRTHVSLTSLCESTRYVNYGKADVEFVRPSWWNDALEEVLTEFVKSWIESERRYLKLLKLGLQPQQARDVLEFSIATNLIQCGFVSDWEHFMSLRDDTAAHPDAQFIASKARVLLNL